MFKFSYLNLNISDCLPSPRELGTLPRCHQSSLSVYLSAPPLLLGMFSSSNLALGMVRKSKDYEDEDQDENQDLDQDQDQNQNQDQNQDGIDWNRLEEAGMA